MEFVLGMHGVMGGCRVYMGVSEPFLSAQRDADSTVYLMLGSRAVEIVESHTLAACSYVSLCVANFIANDFVVFACWPPLIGIATNRWRGMFLGYSSRSCVL